MSRRRRLIAIGSVALLGGLVWFLFPRDRSEPQPIAAGEYVFSTRGFEEVDALGGARHDYPPETGIRIADTGGRCRRLTWRPLEDRLSAWTLCGRDLVAIHEVHEFFGNRDERTYRCEPGSSLRRGWTCSYGDATETTTGGAVGRGRIAGVPVEHIRLERKIEGGVEGTGVREFWLRADGFPVKLAGTTDDVSPSPIGDVRYRERYSLTLGRQPAG